MLTTNYNLENTFFLMQNLIKTLNKSSNYTINYYYSV